jgi:hypothetical protein
MDEFTRHVSDVLALFAGRVQPRIFDEFREYGFSDLSLDASGVQ